MSSKKWLVAFFAAVLALVPVVMLLNFIVDPFGVFPGHLFSWPAYEMTLNPRSAKLSYIEEHHEDYDSYLIGCSGTSSYPVARLNEYFDASFYNMFMYGADMLDVEQIATYLIDNYTVKNLVVNVYIENAVYYDTLPDPRSYGIQPQVTGESPLAFYSRYLFMSPRYAADKLNSFSKDTYLTQSFDVFTAEDGSYAKASRDAEFIGSLDKYLEAYPVFSDYPENQIEMSEEAIDGTLRSLAAMRDLCRDRGINFLVLVSPVYHEYMDYFRWEQVEDFYTRLAGVTPYWDFSLSSVSFEPRYFYDSTHFRNCVGEMALARAFGDEQVYVPEDFGAYVTQETVAAHLTDLAAAHALDPADYTARIPVILYHHISEDADQGETVTPALFREHIAALSAAGYTAVSPEELAAYVHSGALLPEKPVVITFDDGYLSNYEYAYPVLQEYGMCATIFVIGATVGQTEFYKDTAYSITPHFSYEQAREMIASGLISIQSHTYDMHQVSPKDPEPVRENILRFQTESEEKYRAALAEDCARIRGAIMEGTGERTVHMMSYPKGINDRLAQVVLLENGFDISFTTDPGVSTLVRGLPQSLLGLNRYTVGNGLSVEELLDWVSPAGGA